MEEKDKPSHFFYMYKRLFLCIITNKIFLKEIIKHIIIKK